MSTFLDGFIWGLGFSVAVALVLLLGGGVFRFILRRVCGPEKEYSESSGLDVENFRFVKQEDGIKVLGEIVNNGDSSWDDITIEVDAFGENGEFIGQDHDYIHRVIKPGERKYVCLEIECDETPKAIQAHIERADYSGYKES